MFKIKSAGGKGGFDGGMPDMGGNRGDFGGKQPSASQKGDENAETSDLEVPKPHQQNPTSFLLRTTPLKAKV